MRKLKYYNISLPVMMFLVLLIISCTKNFEKINTNPTGTTDEQIKADYQNVIQPVINIQRAIVQRVNWEYQLQQNLNADIYSGYMMTPTPFNGNSNNSNYYMMDGWNGQILNIYYDQLMPEVSSYNRRKSEYPGAEFGDVDGMVRVLRAIFVHRTSDIFGPIIFSKIAQVNADLSVPYDSQQEVYNNLFKELDTAYTMLQPYAAGTKPVGTVFKNSDLIYQGNALSWMKLINTLRLRLALRIVYADATKSKTEGEKALAAAEGLINDNGSNAFVNYGISHPIYEIINGWSDTRSGAPLGAYLNGYNDKRIEFYMTKATDAAVEGQYIGIRNGVDIDAKARYSGYSRPKATSASGDYFSNRTGKAKISTSSEAFFLKAEAALRGWAGAGNVQENYENGIAMSFDEWGAGSAASYINDDTSKPKPYIDPKAKVAGQNDVLAGNPNLSTITIKWDAAAPMETNLERIITQKWIALYPDGQEAWTEFRRTKYPKLFPVVINNSNGVITGFIKRLPIPTAFRDNNKPEYDKAVLTLGGPDNGNTKLWWDKKP